ncbi:putative phosphatidylglycerophosphatase, mitochondrial [Tetrabaena socialis]|uniref:Putative phosphatidylglycerophosphatase, mitochondrial n=1 Tax=Tetrabaena socialis TaxID=47790 RepID=A0A2J7ZU41_9CHLO|nr:putative phosphatidylglycerophosphatase, mitochondrial [Tetrabaena socialis]|eukprot:PNH03791.1 putative phosphatidylglycerophosphatase, mitochondrial [Tetrabaena socialis]
MRVARAPSARRCLCRPRAGRRTWLHRAHSTNAQADPEASGMARAQQNFNSVGVGLFFSLFGGRQSLALPHLAAPDIRHVDWAALRAAGFSGLVFDKDNTLSLPFALEVEPRLQESLSRCLAAFEGRAVLYSNSAGLQQYDPEGKEAAVMEAALGIPVLRHVDKKPGGGCTELEAHFGCPASDLIMVGDRYLTDIAFGNRHGMLTVHVQPLTAAGEPYGVWLARRVEEFWVARWTAAGVHPPAHGRVPYTELAKHLGDPSPGQ